MGLVHLLIAHNKRLPNALILAYPGVRTNINNFNISYLLALQDKILSFHFLQFCLKSYITDDYKRDDDSFLEPILMSDNVIIKIYLGNKKTASS